MPYDREEIVRLTLEYGGGWGLNHARRLLGLIEKIGQGRAYDREALWLAAYLHDWGAYPAWAQKDVDHCLRSRQVAEPFLVERAIPAGQRDLILECIEFHHAPGAERSLEAVLLRDADALDFLGVVGVLRNFAINPRDLRKGFEETKRRRDRSLAILSLPESQTLAAERIPHMDALLTRFEAETLGDF